MATARSAGGLHTLRHIEAGLQAQLSDQRADLQSYVQESARGSEESALRRAEALLGPPVESVKERLDRELPVVQHAIEAAAAEARQELRALRAELASETAQLRAELGKLGEQLPELGERIRRQGEDIATFHGVHRDLWTASESVRARIEEAAAALNAEMRQIAEHSAAAVEKRWCGPFEEKLAALGAAQQDMDIRARHDSAVAMDAAKMVQDTLQCRVEELRLHASQEAQRRAAEVAAGLREEVLQGELLQRFQQRLHENVVCFESRLADFRAQVAEKVESEASRSLATAETSEARISQVAAQVAEGLEATRKELACQQRSHSEAVQDCNRQLRDLKASTDAAETLSRSSLENLRARVGRLADEAAELREGLGQARRSAHDDTSSVRAELRERALQWRAFQEVGMPTLLAHVEQRAGESEGRSVRAALDYAERLRRLPPPAPTAAADGHLRLTDTGMGDLTASPPLPPLAPLTPGSARRPKAY